MLDERFKAVVEAGGELLGKRGVSLSELRLKSSGLKRCKMGRTKEEEVSKKTKKSKDKKKPYHFFA